MTALSKISNATRGGGVVVVKSMDSVSKQMDVNIISNSEKKKVSKPILAKTMESIPPANPLRHLKNAQLPFMNYFSF